MTEPTVNGWLTLMEAAALIGIHHQTLRRHIRDRRIVAIKFRGTFFLDRAVVEAFKQGYNPKQGRRVGWRKPTPEIELERALKIVVQHLHHLVETQDPVTEALYIEAALGALEGYLFLLGLGPRDTSHRP